MLLADGVRLVLGELVHPATELTFERLRLVVLSACQTGMVGTRLPDEVVGLPAGWLQAGAAGVVASLWPVSDRATLALMIKFYELHVLDTLEPVDALWLAQRWLRGLPSWREDCRAAGAARGAQGLEADEVIRGLSDLGDIETAAEIGLDDNTDASQRMQVGESADRVLSDAMSTSAPRAAWRDAQHWAAFAIYGA